MIKHFSLPLILVSILVLATSILFFYSSYSQHVSATNPTDPEVTFVLPTTTVTYKVRDLPVNNAGILVPSADQSEPSFSYNSTTGTVTLHTSPQDYYIPLHSLPNLHNIKSNLSLTPNYQLVSRYAERIELYNTRLNRVYRHELPLTLKDGGATTTFTLPPALIRQIIMPTSLDLSVPLAIDEPVLLSYIIPRLTPKQKEYFHLNATSANIRSALSQRLSLTTTPVVLGVDDGPTSNGELASKYIEVDISQQKLYFFSNGSLAKIYTISTGLDYPTPVGEFRIMNKAPLAFSGIYNAWMPYWMAFEYANDVGAYLGFHEKAYTSMTNGKKIYSHDRQIGDKLTGGCIALNEKDAREVYNHADVGMLVRIVP